MLYTIFCSLDGRELYACPAVDMPKEARRAMKEELADQNGLRPREIYTVDAWR